MGTDCCIYVFFRAVDYFEEEDVGRGNIKVCYRLVGVSGVTNSLLCFKRMDSCISYFITGWLLYISLMFIAVCFLTGGT